MDSQELREFYARMNEGELAKVASEAYDLTDVARPILQDEIVKRGLKIPLITEPSTRPVIMVDRSKVDLVVVGQYWSIADAQKIQELLNGDGLPCYWGEHCQDGPDGLDFDPGVDLLAREEDSQRVYGILRQLASDEPAGEEVGDFSASCPKCASPDIVFHDVDEQTAKFHWSCDACGHEWADDGVELS